MRPCLKRLRTAGHDYNSSLHAHQAGEPSSGQSQSVALLAGRLERPIQRDRQRVCLSCQFCHLLQEECTVEAAALFDGPPEACRRCYTPQICESRASRRVGAAVFSHFAALDSDAEEDEEEG